MLKIHKSSIIFRLLYAVKEFLAERLVEGDALAGARSAVLFASGRAGQVSDMIGNIRAASPGCRITLVCAKAPDSGIYDKYNGLDIRLLPYGKNFNLLNSGLFSGRVKADAVVFPYNNLRRRGYLSLELIAALSGGNIKGGVLSDGRMIRVDLLTPFRKLAANAIK